MWLQAHILSAAGFQAILLPKFITSASIASLPLLWGVVHKQYMQLDIFYSTIIHSIHFKISVYDYFSIVSF